MVKVLALLLAMAAAGPDVPALPDLPAAFSAEEEAAVGPDTEPTKDEAEAAGETGQWRYDRSLAAGWGRSTIAAYRDSYTATDFDSFYAEMTWRARDLGSATAGGFDAAYRFPSLSIGFIYNTLSNVTFTHAISGYSDMAALYGKWSRELISAGHLSFGYDAALGISYSSRVYDPITNPANWYFSSPLLIYFSGGAHLDWRLTGRFVLEAGVQFRHNSSARLSYPNGGLNYVSAGLGARYSLSAPARRSRAADVSGGAFGTAPGTSPRRDGTGHADLSDTGTSPRRDGTGHALETPDGERTSERIARMRTSGRSVDVTSETPDGEGGRRVRPDLYTKGWSTELYVGGGVHACAAEWLAILNTVSKEEASEARLKRWPMASLGLDAVYRTGGKLGIGVCADLFYASNSEALQWSDSVLYSPEEIAASHGYSAFSAGVGLVQEVFYKNVALYLHEGCYLVRRTGVHGYHGPIYEKAGLRWYPQSLRPFFCTVSIKVHKFKADYLDFSVGVKF